MWGAINDIWSIPRRGLIRTAELFFAGEFLDGTHVVRGFHAAVWGHDFPFYVLVCVGASMIFDLILISISPDTRPSACVEEVPELDLKGGK